MTILDTDTFSLLASNHSKVTAKYAAIEDDVTITIITRIEVLQGRFAFVLKASDGVTVLRAQERLRQTEGYLALFSSLPFDQAAAAEFDRLRQMTKTKKIGRADILIACIALANGATLVTRNLRHFRQSSRSTTGQLGQLSTANGSIPASEPPCRPAALSNPCDKDGARLGNTVRSQPRRRAGPGSLPPNAVRFPPPSCGNRRRHNCRVHWRAPGTCRRITSGNGRWPGGPVPRSGRTCSSGRAGAAPPR